MIRINLLKESKPSRGKGFSFPDGLIKKISFGSGGFLIIFIVGIVLKNILLVPSKDKGPEYIVRDEFNPSSLLKRKAIEETVLDDKRHGDKIDRQGVLRIPYEDLTFIEKVNFENHFAKAVTDLLKRNVEGGVDFRRLYFDNFALIKGSGLSYSRGRISSVFKKLRLEGVQFLPKPKTSIFKLKEEFGFKIESIFRPGLDSRSPFKLYADDIPSFDDIDIIIKRIIDASEESGLQIKSGPRRSSADVVRKYRRLLYSFSTVGSYRQFSSFVNKLFQEQIPCSIKSASLKAVSTGSLKIDLEILITTKR